MTNKIWQPAFDKDGNIQGHEHEILFSFQVFTSKEALLSYYPKATPIAYDPIDIEDYSIVK